MTTNDPHGPEPGRPEDPARGRQDPMQGRQDPMQGGHDPMQGRQQPGQGGQQPPQQGRQQGQARYETQGEQRGTYETRQPAGAHEVKADKPRSAHTARLGVLAGLLGLIALGGVTAGLVASNAATTPHVPTPPTTHPPTHATTPPVSPSPTTSAKRLINYTGSASGSSGSFVVPTSTASAHYTYTCPSSLASAPHGFQARLENAAGTDILPIAASRNMSGSGTVALHPKDVGSAYHVVTTTNCPYRVKIDSP
jgi:hypothetical protein